MNFTRVVADHRDEVATAQIFLPGLGKVDRKALGDSNSLVAPLDRLPRRVDDAPTSTMAK
ncbi:hypothetical protein [Bradyrhizobium brasilense]|uniref:hypothetical protein n=1 Tax=Bradyrhizobium brasilense TaxID=1419277 RepID=UPI000B29E0A1|nr:hypothetical protein [Bradyrhizobium brasilense]MCC8972351.1 hypothetical protein [Bradyrhizobium brasilense]